MIPLKFSPDWFNIPSIFIDLFSFIVLLSISNLSRRYYNLNKQKKYLNHLAIAFLIICTSFFFKLLTNLTQYYDLLKQNSDPTIIITTLETIKSYNIFSHITFTLFVFTHLIGLYLLYSIYQKEQSKSNIFLIIYFILISTYYSNLNYYIFHITSFILLSLISLLYIQRYRINKYLNTKILFYAFSIIALSHILFMFITLDKFFYVFAELVQLGGYALLLLILSRIVNHGKKKK